MTRQLIFATRNAAKLRELRELLALDGVLLLSLAERPDAPEIAETGATFAENATLKAVGIAGATGLGAIADDSGLEVDALGGAPGVRYAGEGAGDDARIELLLRNLAQVPEAERTARFRCAVAYAEPGAPGPALLFEGSCEGRILLARRGRGGFGYDPVFFCPELGQTFAEAPAEEKHRVSHRGRAMRQLVAALRARLAR